MAGARPEIYLTQTNDIGRLLNTVGSKLPVDGYVDLPRAIKIAQLSLKHRQNKNQKQRIVVFVGSPIEDQTDRDMTKLGKQLRKNDVALDIINFGHPENIPLLNQLVDNCNKGGNSHLVEINYGSNICDSIITSPVVAYDTGFGDMQVDGAEGGADAPGGAAQPGASAGAGAGSAPAGGQFSEYGGIDPNLDPELAMAIRISLEEAKYQDGDGKKEDDKPTDQPAAAETPGNPDAQTPEQPAATGDDDMAVDDAPAEVDGDEQDDYEEELEAAKLLSMQGAEPTPTPAQDTDKPQEAAQADEDLGGVIDEEFLGEIMQDLGVNMTEDAVKTILNDDEKKDEDKKDEDDK